MSKRKPYISPIGMIYTVCCPERHIIQVGKVNIDLALREMHSLYYKVYNMTETETLVLSHLGEYEMRQELISLMQTVV